MARHLAQLVLAHLVVGGGSKILRLRELLLVVQLEEEVSRSLVFEVALVLALVGFLHAEDLFYLVLRLRRATLAA